MVADAGGDGFECGAQCGYVGGEPSEGGGICRVAALFLDDCAGGGVPVEGCSSGACVPGDCGEGDRLAGCGEFGAGLLNAGNKIVHPVWALPMRSSRRPMSLRCRSASLFQPRSSASRASCSASAFCAARTGR